MDSLTLEHLPTDCIVHIALFKNIKNAAFLHSQLLARNADFEYAFIDASIVVSRRQLLAAAYKSINALLNDSLLTPNVHSEIVVNLNPSTNISEAYRRFGLNPPTQNVLVLKITHPKTNPPLSADQIWTHLSTHVEGEALPPTDENIASLTDWPKVRKYYKLNGLNWLDKMGEAEKKAEAEVLVLGSMALRGV
ncbi:hypothetical protein SAPIO_CDS1262 [Scedosporium apiospermum]|uniref:EKC/KEOPS complex subunit CGI121 n=1 Tax=Pseudallescheria apiosperma TaxID=563466 RepID=A0A084GEX8_PSEDA|nr:uncharacterized protein SAPIO_CDS1262 [Scedosporium apiospermum]KEZ45890.1 hypothetical protein SAPIO_CDS1262 [Scedosporium apiospermum]